MSKKNGGAPDFTNLAYQQNDIAQQNNTQQTNLNRPDQYNAWGSTTWDPSNQTQTSQFSAPVQGVWNNMMAGLQSPFDMSSVDAARQEGRDAAYGFGSSRLGDRFGRGEDALRANLAAQGITDMNSEAARGEYTNFNNAKNDAYDQLYSSAFNLGESAGNNRLSQLIMGRRAPIDEFNALMSGGKQSPFMAASQVDTPDLLGAANSNWQANLLGQNAAMGNITGIGQILAMLAMA